MDINTILENQRYYPIWDNEFEIVIFNKFDCPICGLHSSISIACDIPEALKRYEFFEFSCGSCGHIFKALNCEKKEKTFNIQYLGRFKALDLRRIKYENKIKI